MVKSVLSLIFILTLSVSNSLCQVDTINLKKARTDTLKNSIAIFDSDKVLNVTLRFDLTSFLKKNLKGKSLPGVMTFHLSDTDTINKKVTVKNRGIFRQQNCTFPPMEINFKKGVYAYNDSGKINKLKLVTHCEAGSLHDEYVLREYLVYKLYNVLTDTSFRVRLLRISYLDTQKKRKPIVMYGFFIEPIGILAARTNSTVVKSSTLTQKHIFPGEMDKLAIFNYMIANYDWSIPGQHNVSVVLPRLNNTSGLGVAIPYDFDLTGVVNADYAIPSDETGLKSIRDRIFLGMCQDKTAFDRDLDYYLSKKDEIYKVITDFPYLNQRSKKDITNFLDEFFDQLGRQNSLENLITIFLNSCRKL
jgi:hypothetical protein